MSLGFAHMPTSLVNESQADWRPFRTVRACRCRRRRARTARCGRARARRRTRSAARAPSTEGRPRRARGTGSLSLDSQHRTRPSTSAEKTKVLPGGAVAVLVLVGDLDGDGHGASTSHVAAEPELSEQPHPQSAQSVGEQQRVDRKRAERRSGGSHTFSPRDATRKSRTMCSLAAADPASSPSWPYWL